MRSWEIALKWKFYMAGQHSLGEIRKYLSLVTNYRVVLDSNLYPLSFPSLTGSQSYKVQERRHCSQVSSGLNGGVAFGWKEVLTEISSGQVSLHSKYQGETLCPPRTLSWQLSIRSRLCMKLLRIQGHGLHPLCCQRKLDTECLLDGLLERKQNDETTVAPQGCVWWGSSNLIFSWLIQQTICALLKMYLMGKTGKGKIQKQETRH